MQNLETLKQELINQKAEIEAKGGEVIVANINPSPKEITEGIKTIIGADLSDATAKTSDVLSGKTFYAGDHTKKMGTLTKPDTATATARAYDVLSGKTFFAGNDEIKTGTLTKADTTIATAQEEDVEQGKTFFAGNDEIKTGSYIKPELDKTSAEVTDVLAGKTFYSKTNEIKTGTLTKADTESATATAEDVKQGKTFFAGNDEIKTGSLEILDTSNATATEKDVKQGKTFYAGDNTLKTGTLVLEGGGEDYLELIKILFFYEFDPYVGERRTFEFAVPDYISNLKPYQFYKLPHKLTINLHNHIHSVGHACFSLGVDTTVNGLADSGAEFLQSDCFNSAYIDVNSIPSSVKFLGDYCFRDCLLKFNPNYINVPTNKITFNPGIYACDKIVEVDNLSFPATWVSKSLPEFLLYNIYFHCDFTVPSNVQSIPRYFSTGGNFNHVTIGENVKDIDDFAFGSATGGYEDCEDFTFLSEAPPTLAHFALPNKRAERGLNVYVPDQSVQEYENVLKPLSNYRVLPISQKP